MDAETWNNLELAESEKIVSEFFRLTELAEEPFDDLPENLREFIASK